ncbi:MAG: FUSC family protein [Acetobacteraceae bacterium]|nr:FUSC family protein [Acetobacteraceae bacterium]
MRPLAAWTGLARLGPFHWTNVAPWRAARIGLGIVVPLALGLATDRIEYGAYAALGALPAGTASLQGETRSRVMAVAWASLGAAVSTFVGAITAAFTPWLLVPVVAAWGYLTGLAVALGQRLGVVVLQWSISLMIAVGLPFGPSDAALRAGLVLAGGLFQAVLVALSWTIRPGGREATVLAASYRALSAYASGLAAGEAGPPPPAAFPAHTVLDDPNPLLPRATRLEFLNLLEQAERIRTALAALAAHADDGCVGDASAIRRLLADAASMLNGIADALQARGAGRVALVRDLKGQIAQLSVASTAPWRWAGEALLGQLRAVGRIIARLAEVPEQRTADGGWTAQFPAGGQGGIVDAATVLRANLTIASEAGRHALRLAAAAALAETIVQATGLYQGRWVTLTIFLLLKPDYASTLSRSVQRAVGTMLGAGVGGTVAHFAHLGQAGLVATAGFWIAAAYALFDVNFLFYSVALTAFIVVLLDLLGAPAIATAEVRLLDTAIGSALALAAYLAWPTWEGTTAPEKFARLVEAHRAYTIALLHALARPRSLNAPHLRALQVAARRARSDAEAATARLSEEPVHAPLTPDKARAAIAAVARLAHAELALHALALQEGEAGPPDRPGDLARHLDALSAALATTLDRLALAIRTLQPPSPIPALRPIQTALRDDPASQGGAIVGITDRLVDSADTLDAILRDRPPAPR